MPEEDSKMLAATATCQHFNSCSPAPYQPHADLHHSILLVEDDNVTLKAVEAMLRIHGNYRVTTAMSVQEALQRVQEARSQSLTFDLVLTDLMLPEVSGLSILHQIADTPVVVMSCQDSQASVLQAFEAGAADYLIKPIRKNEVSTLWQHIWRSNRFRHQAVMPGSGTAPPSSALPCNDSGASTSTDIMDQATPQGSMQTGPVTSCLDSAPQRNQDSQQLPPAKQHRGSPRSSLHIPADLKAEPVPGAAVAAVHIDLPLAHPTPATYPPRLDAEACADTTAHADCNAPSPSAAEDQGSSEASGSGGAGANAHLGLHHHGAASSKATQLPLRRPLATSTAGGGGHPRPLPPGLQELAALGLQRQQQEHGGPVPSLWQLPCQQRSRAPPAPRQPSPSSDEAGPEHSSPGLNHSGGSAFTAVTVFLPRLRGAAAEEPEPAADLDALLAAPRSQQQQDGLCNHPPADASRAAGGPSSGQQHALPAAPPHILPSCQGSNPWSSVVLPALPPLSACGSAGGASSHAMQSSAQPALNPVYLPQSVIQLICALSGSAPGCAMATGPAAHAGCSAPTRTSSGQVSDASHFSKTAHRQAAVAKYLEKRKIRSFQKKVRYESRKRLAESRPRVRGQFVKQGGNADAAEARPPAAAAGGPVARKREDEAAEALAAMGQPGGKRSKAVRADEDSVDSDEDIMSGCQA